MPYDKKLHFLAGLVISVAGGIVHPVCGLLFSIAAGIFKEAFDEWRYQGADWRDMIATWAGGILGFLVVEAAKWIF